MLGHRLLRDRGLLLIRTDVRVASGDIECLEPQIAAFIEETGQLSGVMLLGQRFPEWEVLSTALGQLSFVRDHHKYLRRVALLTDSDVDEALPAARQLFHQAEVRHYPYAAHREAMAWLSASFVDPIQT